MTGSSNSSATSNPSRSRLVIGWLAVLLNLATSCLWAFWGSVEAFHEGWWHETLPQNILFTLAYLIPSAVFASIGCIGILWPRIGATVILCLTIWFWWWWDVITRFQQANLVEAMISILMTGMSGLFFGMWWFGRARPRKWALIATFSTPAFVAICSGAYPAYLVATRVNDGDFGIRTIEGNAVRLTWAPQGPGWPMRGGVTWEDAQDRAARLSFDGKALMDQPQGLWRLPTRDEFVRSCLRHGVNAGGKLVHDGVAAKYRTQPDKETPLWNATSEVIYWWTADEVDQRKAWSVVFNGMVVARMKNNGMGSIGFRAVREINPDLGHNEP